jgi:hypothetical protein
MIKRLVLFFCFSLPLLADNAISKISQFIQEPHLEVLPCQCWFPVTYNNLYSVGYFVTPCARMACIGQMGVGFAHVPPYNSVIARAQPFHHLDFGYVYRVFENDLGSNGSGNFKFSVLLPEDTDYRYPGLSFGIESFAGSEAFRNYFVVATHVVPSWGLEGSVGWGAGSYTGGPSRGWFGGLAYYPFWKAAPWWVKGLAFAAEFDPQNLSKDPKLAERPANFPVNYGLKYTLFDTFQLSAAQLRGGDVQATAVASFNFGSFNGIFDKRYDAQPYNAPLNHHPLGCYRLEENFVHELRYILQRQGISLKKAWLQKREYQTLYMQVENCDWRSETTFRQRLMHVLRAQFPDNLEQVVVILEAHTLPVQEYVFDGQTLYCKEDVKCAHFKNPDVLLCCPPNSFQYSLVPIYNTFFGSNDAFRYDIRLNASFWGDLPRRFYYAWGVNWSAISNIGNEPINEFNEPTDLPVVASDLIRYFQVHAVTWNNLYLQKFWNFGQAFFGTVTAGYFQVNYAGIGGELMWYPAHGGWGIGIEGAVTKKRSYRGLGFQDNLLQWTGVGFTEIAYSTLQQYFLDFYLNIPRFKVFSKFSVGQFLAGDKGVYGEAVKYFDNGLRLGGFLTFSDALVRAAGEEYYNRGIILEVPFDFFLQKSCRPTYTYSSATWLRDAGYRTATGLSLFDLVERERRS